MLIGGVALEQYLDSLDIPSRTTHDLDVVLCAESLSPEFVGRLRELLERGCYQVRSRSEGPKCFYRFEKPADESFPKVIEIFSRAPDSWSFSEEDDCRWLPIPTGDSYESIAALLLEDGYYDYAVEHAYLVDGVRIIDAPTLIAFKARAWIDLTERRRLYAEGKSDVRVDQGDIDKHRKDILRIATTLSPAKKYLMPERMVEGIREFTDRALPSGSGPDHIHGLDASMTREEAASLLSRVFVAAER